MNGTTRISSEALKVLGVLAIIPFFLFGVYYYLEGERARQVASSERHDARQGKLITLIEKQHEALVDITALRMAAIDKKLSRLDERGETWEPTMREMRAYMDEMRAIAQKLQQEAEPQ